ncbi:hypothetical protein EGW08_023674, partial [Elysia chlorotica]
ARSIARNAGVSQEALSQHVTRHGLHLAHPAELKLSKFLLRFPEVLSRVVSDLLLHTLCDYLYELTTTFTEFYDQCYCIEKDKATGKILKVNMDRLLLCEATSHVIAACFHILGIEAVDKM